jgi:hypothetical protein
MNLKSYSKEVRKNLRKLIIQNFKADESKASESTLIAMFDRPHFKTLNTKILLEDNTNNDLEQMLPQEPILQLRKEFFEKENGFNSVTIKKRIHSVQKKLLDYKLPKEPYKEICIHPDMTVTELEKEFNGLYKLHTQVFRRSGNIWLETTITDGWTLKEQNNQGEMITAQIANK